MKVQHHGALANITEELVHHATADHHLSCGDGLEVLMTTIRYDLPAGVFSVSRTAPEEFANESKLAACVQRYREGVLCQSKACEIAGLRRAERSLREIGE
ncbi:MAG: UPF0175 family protein [Holophagales bacterium]|nr:UPF0175 family protein [Holophagales bacterium]